MNLFSDCTNVLPFDGEVLYYGPVLSAKQHHYFFDKMMNEIAWQHDEAKIFGKHIITKRKVAWYGDKAFRYRYSGTEKLALPWTRPLQALKEMVEQISNQRFNSCLLNLYHSGEEGMAWHSDDEKELEGGAAIASLSLGAERKFSFKHKANKETTSLVLEQGSLLLMQGETQKRWLHALPKTKRVTSPRVNLTFRKMIDNS